MPPHWGLLVLPISTWVDAPAAAQSHSQSSRHDTSTQKSLRESPLSVVSIFQGLKPEKVSLPGCPEFGKMGLKNIAKLPLGPEYCTADYCSPHLTHHNDLLQGLQLLYVLVLLNHRLKGNSSFCFLSPRCYQVFCKDMDGMRVLILLWKAFGVDIGSLPLLDIVLGSKETWIYIFPNWVTKNRVWLLKVMWTTMCISHNHVCLLYRYY